MVRPSSVRVAESELGLASDSAMPVDIAIDCN